MSATSITAEALRRAALRGSLAPSLLNTQPWRFRITDRGLQVLPDRSRLLPAHDPDGRQLAISCGCALLQVRASLAADRVAVEVERFDTGLVGARLDGSTPSDPLAELTVVPGSDPSDEVSRDLADDLSPAATGELIDRGLAELIAALDPQHIERLPSATGAPEGPQPGQWLRAVAEDSTATLVPLTGDQRRQVDELHRQARQSLSADPAIGAEERAWASQAGPAIWAGAAPPLTSFPLDVSGDGAYPTSTGPLLLALSTPADSVVDWVRAGEAADHLTLLATCAGFTVGMSTVVAQLPPTRDRLRDVIGNAGHPQLLLRIGLDPPRPAARRRRLYEVIIEEDAPAPSA